jgi:NitT/TauT family transport system permease protein
MTTTRVRPEPLTPAQKRELTRQRDQGPQKTYGLRLGSWGAVVEVVILGHLDAVIDAIRQNAAMGWVMLTMVEGLVRFEGGLGAMMLAEDKHIKLDAVFAIQIVVLAIGILQDWGFVAIRRLLCPYASLTLERQ